jgi:hypothetical protein
VRKHYGCGSPQSLGLLKRHFGVLELHPELVSDPFKRPCIADEPGEIASSGTERSQRSEVCRVVGAGPPDARPVAQDLAHHALGIVVLGVPIQIFVLRNALDDSLGLAGFNADSGGF